MTISPHQPDADAAPSPLAGNEALNRLLQSDEPLHEWEAGFEDLRTRLGERGRGNLGLGQINVTPGDLAGNARKILRYLQAAEALRLDLVVFPELALMGYPPRDVIGRHPFLVAENRRWLNALAKKTGETYAMVGFVEAREPARQTTGGKAYYNAVALLGRGNILQIVRKQLLPSYDEFEDTRQFEAGPADLAENPGLMTIHGKRYGVSICEDLWNDPDFFHPSLYGRDPIAALAKARPEALINLSASPTRSRKEQMKHNLCTHLARKYRTPLVYVNQVGTVDEVSFDGASRAYDADGELFARAAAFEEALLLINPFQREGRIVPLPPGLAETLSAFKAFQADDASDLGRTYDCLRQGIRDYFRKTGFQRAVLGLSGGLDSSVTAVLLSDALGPANVLGVSMPSALTPEDSRTDARLLASNLGIGWAEIPIGEMTEAFQAGLHAAQGELIAHWEGRDARSNAPDNVQAISRATLLRQIGNEFRALPIATSDKSEFYLGYATVNGDMSGALAPLGDVPKTKVRALARWLNAHRAPGVKTPLNVLPMAVIEKPSGADLKRDALSGRLVTAEEELMPYEFADEVIWRLECLRQSQQDMRTARFQYEENRPLTPEQKAAWLEIFFNRMGKAVFKWFIAPPMLIVEGNGSLAKSDYHHPITAAAIHWPGHTDAEIAALLEPDGRINS